MNPTLDDVVYPVSFLMGPTKDLRFWRILLRRGDKAWALDRKDLVGPPEIESESRFEPGSSPRRTFSSTVRIQVHANATALAPLRQEILSCAGPFEAEVRLYENASSSAASEILGSFGLVDIETADGVAVIRLRRGYPGEDRSLCRDGSRLDGLRHLEPEAWLPQVFGRAALEIPPLFSTANGMLDLDLEVDSTELSLTASVSWPPTGRAQVNDEVIFYRGISEDGRHLLSLTRESPRRHRRRSVVVSIPLSNPAWCLCDHPGQAIEVRLENADGDLLEQHEVTVEDLAGRGATVLRREALPLVIGHSRTMRVIETPRDRRLWRVLSPTSAYDPYDAFVAADPQQGAVLTLERPLLRASFHRDPSLEEDRFDRVESALLSVEYTDTPGWMEETRLRVSVIRAGERIDRLFDREGARFVHAVRGEGTLPLAKSGVTSPRWIRCGFDRVEAEGPWSGLAAAVDGHMQDAAAVNSPLPASLAFHFLQPPVGAGHPVLRLRLCGRIGNTSDGDLPVRMMLRIPGQLDRHQDHLLAAGRESTLTLEVELPTNVVPSMLFEEAARYGVELLSGGEAEVREVWLDLEQVESPSQSIDSLAATRIPVLATLDLRLVYNRIEVDITPLLPSEDRWSFFASEVEPLVVEIELLHPPTHPLWDVAVRNVHWRLSTFAATSVRPTTRLWAMVGGRCDRVDGTANPAEAVWNLLQDPLHGALASGSIDAPSFDAAAVECDRRDLAVAAAFADPIRVGRALEFLLGESCLALAPVRGSWRLWASAPDPGAEPAPLIEDQHRHRIPERSTLAPSGPADAFPPSIHGGGGTPVYTSPSAEASGYRVRWLVRGGPILSRWIASRAVPTLSVRTISIDSSWLPLPPGIPVALVDPLNPGLRQQGEVSLLRLAHGAIEVQLAHLHEILVRPIGTGAALVHSPRSRCWWFLIDGRVVARLDDAGDLLLAGEFTNGPLPGLLIGSSIVYDPVAHVLQMIYTAPGGASAGLLIDVAGNLRTPLLLREGVATTHPASAEGFENRADAATAGGTVGDSVPLAFNLSEILLRGTLRTHQIL